jgi:F0F1-type ATP synthase assembly protein I
MTDPDLRELAELWQQPDAAAQAQFEAAARRVRRQARFLGFTDLALGAVIVIGTILGFVLGPEPLSAVIAALIIAATVWLGLKRWQLRQMSRTLDTSDRPSFVASSIRNATASLRRVTLSLYFLPLLALLAVVSKLSARHGGRLDHPLAVFAEWAGSPRGLIVIAIVGLFMAILYRARRKCLTELGKLQALSRDYHAEATLDAEAED